MEEKDMCICSVCNAEIDWEGSDLHKGHIWVCEECGEYFCTDCFEQVHGCDAFDDMYHNGTTMICPDCYKKYLLEEGRKNYVKSKMPSM